MGSDGECVKENTGQPKGCTEAAMLKIEIGNWELRLRSRNVEEHVPSKAKQKTLSFGSKLQDKD